MEFQIFFFDNRESFAVPVKCSEGVVKQEKILHSIHKMSLELTALRAKPEHICYLGNQKFRMFAKKLVATIYGTIKCKKIITSKINYHTIHSNLSILSTCNIEL